MKQKWLNYVAGGAAGLANGLFGGGGGMVVIPLLSRSLPPEKLYATCVGLIFPVCAVSGEAAGTAAALGKNFPEVDITALQNKLKENGVLLHWDERKQ